MPGSDPVDLIGSVIGTGYRRVARPLLFRSAGGDAEAIHHRTLNVVARLGNRPVGRALASALAPRERDVTPVDLLGLRFPNRIGLAAGMDKNGVAVLGWQRLGFGHVELGTVTPRAQPGNPTPRLFRLPASQAIINRMGFNNDGVDQLATVLAGVAHRPAEQRIPVGVSIGKWKQTPLEDAVEDYLVCARRLHGLADYLAVNVSSPNTPNLRSLQDAEPLGELLRALVATTKDLATGALPPGRAEEPKRSVPMPVLLKLAPDLSQAAIEQAVGVAADAGVAGLIATNTTIAREQIDPRDAAVAQQSGGLSGAPLTERSREVVRTIRDLTDLPLIGVGGVMTGADARAMVDAGADLVQIYSGLIYAGPALIRDAVYATR